MPESIKEQFKSLKVLEDGWLGGDQGKACDPQGLYWLEILLVSFNLPIPYIYPTPGGNVQAEWDADEVEIDVHFDLKSRKAVLMVFDKLGVDVLKEKEFQLSRTKEVEGLIEALGECL